MKWTLEAEIPAEVPALPNERMSPKKIQLNKTTRNLKLMSRMLKCATQNLAEDGSMTSKHVGTMLDAMSQVVNNASEALRPKSTGKRKREGEDAADSPESSDEEEDERFANMNMNELKQEMTMGGRQDSESVGPEVNKCTCLTTLRERNKIQEYVQEKDLGRHVRRLKDGSMKVRAKDASAFETLKYVFISSMRDLVDNERDGAFIDWCHYGIEDWTVTESNEREKEITLKKIRNHKVN